MITSLFAALTIVAIVIAWVLIGKTFEGFFDFVFFCAGTLAGGFVIGLIAAWIYLPLSGSVITWSAMWPIAAWIALIILVVRFFCNEEMPVGSKGTHRFRKSSDTSELY